MLQIFSYLLLKGFIITILGTNNAGILPTNQIITTQQVQSSTKPIITRDDFGIGYNWARTNNINNFASCQNKFGTSLSEDGCNQYVKENYTGYQEFHGYDCTEDCSGHEAGYNWAEENDISDTEECDGNSDSFIEGCQAYVEENY